MERHEKPSYNNRRTGDGNIFDFKLLFQASRVPNTGWDKLVVSLLSVQTGRTIAKTPRAHVRNGTCQWPDPIIESTVLMQNPVSGHYEDKLYKLVVQMGALRAGILGEATINLSEYVTVEPPGIVSLPLRNCSSGAILHVKVEYLNPYFESRVQTNGSVDHEHSNSVSEDNSSNSDLSENITTGSVGSATNKNRDRSSKRSSHYSSDSRELGPKTGIGGHSIMSCNADGNYDRNDTQSAGLYSCGKFNKQTTHDGYKVATDILQKLEAAELTIHELREQALSWERQARKLSVDVESLKQKLSSELRNGTELKVEISALKAERDRLMSDLEQQKTSRSASNKGRTGTDFSWWEMNDAQRQITVLQEEIAHEKDVNANLQVQSQKIQDSNEKLLALLNELEETLEVKQQEIDQLHLKNTSLEEEVSKQNNAGHAQKQTDISHGKTEEGVEEWKHKWLSTDAVLAEKEETIKFLQSQLDIHKAKQYSVFVSPIEQERRDVLSNEDVADHAASKKQLELLLSEATSENAILDSKIKNLMDAIANKDKEIKKLEIKVTDLISEKEELQSQNVRLKDLNHEAFGKLSNFEKEMVKEQESHKQEIDIHMASNESLKSKAEMLEQQLQDASMNVTELHTKCAKLQMQVMYWESEASKKEQLLNEEIKSLLAQKEAIEHRACKAEEQLLHFQQEKTFEIDLLDGKLEQLSLIGSEKEKMASQARAEVNELRTEKLELENNNDKMKETIEKQKQDNIELQKTIAVLENEVLQKTSALSKLEEQTLHSEYMGNEVNSVEVLKLKERCHSLEEDVQATEGKLIMCKMEFAQREADLLSRIEKLELANEQLVSGLGDSETNQLQNELLRLQNQNSYLSRKEQELLSTIHMQKLLEEQVRQLQESNDLLEARLSKFMETAKNPFLLEKIVHLETELAEAVEANKMYKQQLRSVFEESSYDINNPDIIKNDLLQYKMKTTQLEEELKNMRERYSLMSLKLAEAEAERGELMITVKNLKGAKNS